MGFSKDYAGIDFCECDIYKAFWRIKFRLFLKEFYFSTTLFCTFLLQQMTEMIDCLEKKRFKTFYLSDNTIFVYHTFLKNFGGITFRKEIFAEINFHEFFFDISQELIFAYWALLRISRELGRQGGSGVIFACDVQIKVPMAVYRCFYGMKISSCRRKILQFEFSGLYTF